MKIVNAHVHMIELEKMVKKNAGHKVPGGISVLQDIEATMPLLSPEVLIGQMEDAGVSQSVLYAVDAPIVYSSNEYVQTLCAQFPDRLMGFASVNPNDKDAVERLDKAVNEQGLRGLKLHPPLQNFFPNNESVFPIYEKAVELKIPVVFHVGTTPFGSLARLSQANPILIDDVAVEFPDLRIMLTHLGTLSHLEAFMVVEKNPNVYIDTSAYLYEIKELLTMNLITRLGPHKIIFGTDYPMPYAGLIHQMKDFVECLKGLNLTEDILEGIFYKNFETFMNYESSNEDIDFQQFI
ncbi:metal-dependent hydrolase [Candidatus Scalindua japonica]|uniref:Metal-dependent hydrolase n=1 Tax=Candidatus Scalindua japonica TaxID=1284222 RepID=A0A286U2E3_9BACT|nr:amidohydrolase family protein [Candidatus Scalindua japonica]GAX62296.1 metal-dependent hydrolase [Candidatus Scalindua japonica]